MHLQQLCLKGRCNNERYQYSYYENRSCLSAYSYRICDTVYSVSQGTKEKIKTTVYIAQEGMRHSLPLSKGLVGLQRPLRDRVAMLGKDRPHLINHFLLSGILFYESQE